MKVDFGPREPKDALAFWKDKAQLKPAEYAELTQQAKARAFAVSGLAKRDQIATVHAALQAALENGETLAAFKKRLGPLLKQKGWVGEKAWRVANIYRTNMQSAYQAGRYTQMKKTAEGRPFWRYMAVRDRRTRPTHLAMHGLVFRHDHEFWSTYYPPNGWQCRCTVQTLSQRQVDQRDLEVQTTVPRLVEAIDPVSGARLPARPLVSEPGWGGNVGQDWLQGLAPAETDAKLITKAARAICKDGRGMFADNICAPPLDSIERRHIIQVDAKDILASGMPEEDYVRLFLREFGVTDLEGSVVHNLPGNVPVVINKDLFWDKATNKLKVTKNYRERYVKLIARTLIDPYEVWHVPVEVAKTTGRAELRDAIRVIALFEAPDKDIGGYVAFNLIRNKWQGSTAMAPKNDRSQKAIYDYLEKMRRGTLLYRRP